MIQTGPSSGMTEGEYGDFFDLLVKHISEVEPKELAHHGVKGMKWGVRKDDSKGSTRVTAKQRTESMSVKLKNGDTLELSGDKTPPMARLIARMSPKFAEKVNAQSSYKIKDPSGKPIGELNLLRESPTSLNVVWVGIDKSQRGKGYATAVMNAAIEHARNLKLDTVTLEVPGRSPDAKHVYEKLGFKDVKVLSTPEEDSFWGGLTAMKLDLHAKHGEDRVNELIHYGVKGMKWGVRKAKNDSPNPRYTDQQRAKDHQLHGARGVKRINRKLNQGKSLTKARKAEVRRDTAQATTVAGALIAGRLLVHVGPALMQGVAIRAETKRGEAETRAKLKYETPMNSKRKRDGSYKITNL